MVQDRETLQQVIETAQNLTSTIQTISDISGVRCLHRAQRY